MKLSTNMQVQAHTFLLTVHKYSLLFAPRQQNFVILWSCISWDVLATHHSFQPILLLFLFLIQQPGEGLSCPLTGMPVCKAAEDKAVTAELERQGWFLHYSAPPLLLLHLTHKGESVDGSHQIRVLLLSCSKWWGWTSSSKMGLNCNIKSDITDLGNIGWHFRNIMIIIKWDFRWKPDCKLYCM